MNTELDNKRFETVAKIENLSNKDFEKLSIFLAGMEAQKNIDGHPEQPEQPRETA